MNSRCPTKDVSSANHSTKKLIDDFPEHPPFYFNIHKHHPQINQLMKLNKIIERLRVKGYRASKTHFDKLATRTDAPLSTLFDVMVNLNNSH